MTELYLIAHKVRGEPAFDIAVRVECPECHAMECAECDHTGYWWIVPTSGHRAYPYWCDLINPDWIGRAGDMPEGLPDHYAVSAAPRRANLDALAALIAASAPQAPPSPPMRRRV
jgi:hypothetical protein